MISAMHVLTHHKNKILHVDADSFFASCERANNPRLHDKPVCVVAGKHGIILAATYDAKCLGVKTAMPVWEAVKLLPKHKAYYVDSNFSLYARYSERMFEVFHRFTPDVEEYSVDEAFLDMGGLRRVYRTDYVGMAHMIQQAIWQELGLPVSIGVAPTKTLAKMASKKAKPFGVFEVPKKAIHTFLNDRKLSDVPGFGANTVALLQKWNVMTLLDVVRMKDYAVQRLIHKPGLLLWHELQGRPMLPLKREVALPKSLSRIRTFRITNNVVFIRAELVNHLFLCCYKLRRKGVRARKVFVYVRDHNFRIRGVEYRDVQAHTSSFRFASQVLSDFTAKVRGISVRSVGAIFSELERDAGVQLSVFEEDAKVQRQQQLFAAADHINEKYGRYTLKPALLHGKGYSSRRRCSENLGIPRLGKAG